MLAAVQLPWRPLARKSWKACRKPVNVTECLRCAVANVRFATQEGRIQKKNSFESDSRLGGTTNKATHKLQAAPLTAMSPGCDGGVRQELAPTRHRSGFWRVREGPLQSARVRASGRMTTLLTWPA